MALTRIMYVERKDDLGGPATISRVTFSNSGRSIYYRGLRLHKVRWGFKHNYEDDEGRPYWVSGPKRKGGDRLLHGERLPIPIDEDAREEYWLEIRKLPALIRDTDASS